jgi:hypothetical protein
MGSNFCCLNKKNDFFTITNDRPFRPMMDKSSKEKKLAKITKIQNSFRKLLAKKYLIELFNQTQIQLTEELEKKKLINESNIIECESNKIYTQLLMENKIQTFSNQLINYPELNNLYSKISKYTFIVPFYVVTSPNEVYKGSWDSNKQYHGHGIKYEFNDDKTMNKRIEGLFIHGFLFGRGMIIFSNGEILTGQFKKNIINGKGEHYRKDQSVYKGEFKNGKYEGMGNETFLDGSSFEGFYSSGQKKYGKYEWKNGSKYQGEFADNTFNGRGIYTWKNGKKYCGNWRGGKMDGKGIFNYPDGSFYEGEFVNGLKCGNGKYVWNKDRYYEGSWENDKQNGFGIYHYKSKIIKGIWLNGKFKKINNKLNNDIGKKLNSNNVKTEDCKQSNFSPKSNEEGMKGFNFDFNQPDIKRNNVNKKNAIYPNESSKGFKYKTE